VGRRRRAGAEVREDLVDHGPLRAAGDEAHHAVAAGAREGVDLEDLLQQRRPAVLHGFPLQSGDDILVTDHEHPDMIETILQRVKREGVVKRVGQVPALAENNNAFRSRLSASITPRTKLLLVSHVSAWSGEVLPIADISALARSRGVAVLVDAAQSVGLLDVNFDTIGCDFLATSLHKWLGAPIATGALLMRPEQDGHVWPLHPPSWDTITHPMDLYEWTGTFNVPACAAVADAVEFQRAIGAPRKRARMRLLGDYWQNKLRPVSRVHLLTPPGDDRSTGVGTFAIDGIPSADVVKHLRLRKKVLVQDKSGRQSPFANAIRVSPGPCASLAELDTFVAAVIDVATRGLPAPR